MNTREFISLCISNFVLVFIAVPVPCFCIVVGLTPDSTIEDKWLAGVCLVASLALTTAIIVSEEDL